MPTFEEGGAYCCSLWLVGRHVGIPKLLQPTCISAVKILKSFVGHRSYRILDFVRPNKILSDQTFL